MRASRIADKARESALGFLALVVISIVVLVVIAFVFWIIPDSLGNWLADYFHDHPSLARVGMLTVFGMIAGLFGLFKRLFPTVGSVLGRFFVMIRDSLVRKPL